MIPPVLFYYGILGLILVKGQVVVNQILCLLGDGGVGAVNIILEEHDVPVSLKEFFPFGHGLTIGVASVGVSVLCKVGPVVAHLAAEVVMMSVEGSPALHEGFECEPQLAGMEGSCVVTGDGGSELVVVYGSAMLCEYACHHVGGKLEGYEGHRLAEGFGVVTGLGLAELDVPVGVLAHGVLCPFNGIALGNGGELAGGVAGHKLNVILFTVQNAFVPLVNDKLAVDGSVESVSGLDQLVLDELGVKLAGFGDAAASENFTDEFLAIGFCHLALWGMAFWNRPALLGEVT